MMTQGKKVRKRRAATGTPSTLSEAWEFCAFRSIVAIGEHDLYDRIQGGFAAIGGEVEPIADDRLQELVEVVKSGGSVVIMGSSRKLRDAAKRQVMAAVHGVAGCA